MINYIWLAALGALYLFFVIASPPKNLKPVVIKAVAPVAKTAKTDAHDNAAHGEEAAATEAPADGAAGTEGGEEAAPVAKTEAYETDPVNLDTGKKVWLSTCIKCHNKDPNVKGPIGPEVVDAPLEVMMAKVATGRYPDVLPPGFVPKRKTKAMVKQPQHIKDVPSIHAWVQSVKK